jgi:hypothetical protein
MAARTPGINLDDTESAMVRLAQSLSLSRHIKRHNDPADPYHMNEHQTFCLGYQFKDGITFMCLSTPHMLLNFARMTNCGWQKQIHLDGAFNFCVKDFGLVGIGCNRMGAECGFCTRVREQDKPHMRELLLSEDAQNLHYPVDKPSSDCTKQFWSFSKKKFDPDIKVQTCGQHATGECNCSF